MRYYLDASAFLHLLLEGERADEAESILERVERGDAVGYVSALVVEEVAFKLLVAKASELGVSEFWEFKRKFTGDAEFRGECVKPVREFERYLDSMAGLAWVPILDSDLWSALRIVERYSLLPADAVHAALALRLGVPIATFDEDFVRVPGLSKVP